MLRLDLGIPGATLRQLRPQITAQVADGTLQRCAGLPTVRSRPATWDIAPDPVAWTYRELQAAGLIIGHGHAGTSSRAWEQVNALARPPSLRPSTPRPPSPGPSARSI